MSQIETELAGFNPPRYRSRRGDSGRLVVGDDVEHGRHVVLAPI
jgi:hypothetical protein